MGQPDVADHGDHDGQAALQEEEALPWLPVGRAMGAGAGIAKAGEDAIADQAAEGAANRSLAVEERQALAKLEACVEEREVGDRDGVEAGCSVVSTASSAQGGGRGTADATRPWPFRRTLETADEDAQRVQLPFVADPSMQRGAEAPQQHAGGHPAHHAMPAAQGGGEGLEGDEKGKGEGEGGVEVTLVQTDVGGEVGAFGVAQIGLVQGIEEEQQGEKGEQ